MREKKASTWCAAKDLRAKVEKLLRREKKKFSISRHLRVDGIEGGWRGGSSHFDLSSFDVCGMMAFAGFSALFFSLIATILFVRIVQRSEQMNTVCNYT